MLKVTAKRKIITCYLCINGPVHYNEHLEETFGDIVHILILFTLYFLTFFLDIKTILIRSWTYCFI